MKILYTPYYTNLMSSYSCCLDALHHVRCIYHSGRNCCCDGQGIVVAMGKEARRQRVHENTHTVVYMLVLFQVFRESFELILQFQQMFLAHQMTPRPSSPFST